MTARHIKRSEMALNPFSAMRITINLPASNPLPAIQIPIAATDYVTSLRRSTAVSCIELCRTPAR